MGNATKTLGQDIENVSLVRNEANTFVWYYQNNRDKSAGHFIVCN